MFNTKKNRIEELKNDLALCEMDKAFYKSQYKAYMNAIILAMQMDIITKDQFETIIELKKKYDDLSDQYSEKGA